MNLLEDYPHLYKELKQICTKLEKFYKDICDVEFTIQNGKLYVLGVRIAQRSRFANLKSSVDFFLEGSITLKEALSRIDPLDLEAFLKPQITNRNKLEFICRGLGSSPGTATGKISFSSSEIVELKDEELILVRAEVSPEDISGISYSQGILTSRGAMTSHATLIARQMGKCCVTGASAICIDYRNQLFSVNGNQFMAGEWITIEGNTGNVYKGKALLNKTSWRDFNETIALFQMLDMGIKLNTELNDIGKSWVMRDYLLHRISIQNYSNKKRYYQLNDKYISFNHPSEKLILSYRQKLKPISSGNKIDFQYILKGFLETLLRLLSHSVGIGNHDVYFRPLLDPMKTLKTISKELRKQLVLFEFFNINKYINNLIDIYSIKIYLEIDIFSDNDLWFLDDTNIKGESIVAGSYSITSFILFVNDVKIKNAELPLFYNLFRKREHFWTWYQDNKTTYAEVKNYLKKDKKERIKNHRLWTITHELGLLENDRLTLSGTSLIN